MNGFTVFDEYAAEYDRWYDEHPAVFRAEADALRQVLPSHDIRLDVGTGSGRFAAELGITHGVDPSAPLLSLARQRGIDVVRGTAESLPYRSGCVHAVLMMTVICFLEDPGRAFREIYRVLEPGGVLVLGFIDRDSQDARILGARDPPGRFFASAHFHSRVDVIAALSDAGFYTGTFTSGPSGICLVTARKP